MNFNPWIAGPVFVCVALPLLFGCVLTVVAWVGGWSRLANAYRTSEPFPHPRLWMKAPISDFGAATATASLAADAENMYMGVIWPFGFNHPNLKLPWAEATAAQSSVWFGMKLTAFTFERAPSVTIRLKKSTADQLIAAAEKSRDAKSGGSSRGRSEN